ncbi:hypothetical protein LAZ67_21000221 [Cordylochernes scorpioides]|uniref:Uncharacterized protein n=1 Tax=Cordylochernes scorpioides TaxID=51811 RepID=A0ABY6LLC4_9ARAC|nr:hypothetical protein LAZ67_21000221 [Cordylochernes scorpioides]
MFLQATPALLAAGRSVRMLLAPSSIHYIKGCPPGGGPLVPEPPPKLQVARKNGAWFALDNGSLQAVRELERQGRLSRVAAEVVSLSKVPRSLQAAMVVEDEEGRSWGSRALE